MLPSKLFGASSEETRMHTKQSDIALLTDNAVLVTGLHDLHDQLIYQLPSESSA